MKFDMRAVIRAMGSRRMATTLLLTWLALLVMWIIPFEFYGLDVSQLRYIISREPFFRVVYGLLVLNTVACVWSGIPRTIRRAHDVPSPESHPRGTGAFCELGGEWSSDKAGELVRRRGFRSVVVGDGWVWAVRNSISPWGHVMLHLGLVLFVIAAVMSLDPGSYVTGKSVVVEGETFDTASSEIVDISPAGAKMPDVRFTVRQVSSRFHDDLLLFTKLQARILDAGGDGHDLRVGHPWFISPFTAVSLDDFGYAPVVNVSSESTTFPGQIFKLKAFPSGTADYFNVSDGAGSTYRVKVAVFGDYVDRAGAHGIKSFNLTKDPRLLVSVGRIRSDDAETPIITDRLVGLDDAIDIGGAKLSFESVREYGLFRITRVTSAPVVFAGLVVVLAGFVMALLFPRVQVLFIEEDGSVRLYVRDDQYRRSSRLEAALVREWEIEA